MSAHQDAVPAVDIPLDRAWREFTCDRGRPLPRSVRRPLETALAADFANVVVHTSPLADRLARQLGARAFAWGEHVGFANGAYDPASRDGLRMLAHELAHVTQQRLGRTARGRERHAPSQLEHLQEKWNPVFVRKCDQQKCWSSFCFRRN